MISKLGKGILYLNVFAVLCIGILDDVHIDVYRIYEQIMHLELLLVPMMLFDSKKERLRVCMPVLGAVVIWIGFMISTAVYNKVEMASAANAFSSFCYPMVLFFGSIVFWDKSDLKQTYRFLKIWYVLNLVLSVVEFLVFDKRDDMLGGFIGCRMGSNQYMNLLHCTMLIAALTESFSKNHLDRYTVFVVFSSVFLAALQELKLFFYEFSLIFLAVSVIYLVQKRLGWKTWGCALLAAAASLGIGLLVIYLVYPFHLGFIVGTKSYEMYEKSARFPYAIGRVHFIGEMNELWFHGDMMKNLIGLGFGGGHPGTLFYEENEPMHYLYFVHQTLFLEGGLIGLALFVLIFMVSALQNGWNFLRNRPMTLVQSFGAVFSLIMALNVFYNEALQSQTAMLIWPIMAVPYITMKGGAHADALSSESSIHLR